MESFEEIIRRLNSERWEEEAQKNRWAEDAKRRFFEEYEQHDPERKISRLQREIEDLKKIVEAQRKQIEEMRRIVELAEARGIVSGTNTGIL
jgi:predicted RNase H-like nuclease (RuvC/YqgF family)